MNTKKLSKRLLSLILSMSMILSLVICKEIPVNAETIDKTDTWNWIIDQIKDDDSEFMADRVKYLMYNAEYLPSGTYTDSELITDTETNEIIDVMAWECLGYSRYAFYKLFGYVGNVYVQDLYEVINPDNTNSEEGVKVALSSDSIKAGANIRTNYFTIDYSDGTSESIQHSMIFLTTDENGTGFYCLDANFDPDKVTVRHWTYKEFANIFSGGIKSITVPKIYPQTGKYTITAASGLEYRTISTSNEISGIIPSGTTIEITELDPTVNTDTIILDTEPQGNRITLRAIMGKTTYDGQTAWVTTNAPNSLDYVGSLTNDPTSTAGGDLNFFQRIGAFFNAIWKAIVEITINIIHPKDAEAASGDNVSSSSNQVDSTADAEKPTTIVQQYESSETSLDVAETQVTSDLVNEIHTLTGTFQGVEWGDFCWIIILGDDGVEYSFWPQMPPGGINWETLDIGHKVKVTWQNVDKELPIGDTTITYNLDEILSLELNDN